MPLLTLPRQFHVNSAGSPYAGAKLHTYRAGTTTELDVYKTSALSVAHTNPVVADANGIFPAIYIDPGSGYDLKIVLTTSADVELWTEDDIPRAETEFSTAAFSGSVTVTTSITAGSLIRTNLQLEIVAANPRIWLYESDQASDEKAWDVDLSAKVLSVRTRTDADAAGKNALVITRGTGTALSSIAIGNATDAPAITVNGKSLDAVGSFTGTLNAMTTTVTGTVYYIITGRMCTMFIAASITGTSNATTQLRLTGMPDACKPVGIIPRAACYGIVDDGDSLGGFAEINGGSSVIGFYLYDSTSVTNRVSATDTFTSSGTKGLTTGWSITYPLAIA